MSVGKILIQQGELIEGTRAVFEMNQENKGYDCPGCAWPDDRKGLKMDICENGIKHVTWEMTAKRVGPEFSQMSILRPLRSSGQAQPGQS